MNMPAFAFSAPVAQTPAAVAPVPAQVQGFLPPADLMALATCDDFESGKPRLPIGEYTVQITKVLRPNTRKCGQPFVAEYVVEESNNETPAGRQSSYFRRTDDQDGIPYLAQWLGQVLGANTKEERATVKALLPFIVMAEVSEQPVGVVDVRTGQPLLGGDGKQVFMQPGMIRGHRFHVSVIEGKPSKKTGKVYTDEIWTRLA